MHVSDNREGDHAGRTCDVQMFRRNVLKKRAMNSCWLSEKFRGVCVCVCLCVCVFVCVCVCVRAFVNQTVQLVNGSRTLKNDRSTQHVTSAAKVKYVWWAGRQQRVCLGREAKLYPPPPLLSSEILPLLTTHSGGSWYQGGTVLVLSKY